jgi:hypothetical protein
MWGNSMASFSRLVVRPRLWRLLALLTLSPVVFGATEDTWWPAQRVPETVVRVSGDSPAPGLAAETRMLVQAVAGLAAQDVNAGRSHELVWAVSDNPSVERWGGIFLKQHPTIRVRATLGIWDLIDEYARSEKVKGYILYRRDGSQADPGQKYRPGMDPSVNVATSLAGILHGVIVGEELEAEAKRHGLSLLMDVRNKTQQWCFDTYREKFHRDMLCTQDPQKPNARDYAIAQSAFTVYGPDAVVTEAMKWIDPLAPILGWNGGDEFQTTRLATVWGHFQTCTDWVQNLPVLMAGANSVPRTPAPHLDPRKIEWDDVRPTVSFTCSDGDNVQWFETNFFDGPGYYWSNPHRGQIPFGWTAPFTHLVQLCPEAIDYARDTRTANDTFIEWHSGYYYPDFFAQELPERWQLLAEHSRRSWAMMRRSGTNIIGFNFRHYDSPDAKKACAVFASQTDGLLGILAFQYSPYNAGAGTVYWVKDKLNRDVPVVTLRYQIWWNLNGRANTGTPSKIAREIRESAEHAEAGAPPRHDWAMVHAWSYFKPAPDGDEAAENLPPKKTMPPGVTYESLGGVRGYDPVLWCAARLPPGIHVVPIEEMMWRIRQQHDPEQTRQLMAAFGR